MNVFMAIDAAGIQFLKPLVHNPFTIFYEMTSPAGLILMGTG
jgi:hypothetical protein